MQTQRCTGALTGALVQRCGDAEVQSRCRGAEVKKGAEVQRSADILAEHLQSSCRAVAEQCCRLQSSCESSSRGEEGCRAVADVRGAEVRGAEVLIS